jgi:hypothetical protein
MKVKNLKPGDKFVLINPIQKSQPYILLEEIEDPEFATGINLISGKRDMFLRSSEAKRVRCFFQHLED